MRFTIARTAQQRSRLDQLFESVSISRDSRTDELVILWRPRRCLTLAIGAPVCAYFLGALAVTLWMQMLTPAFPVKYAEVVNPLEWMDLANSWSSFRHDASRPRDLPPASYTPKETDLGPGAGDKSATVEATRVGSIQGSIVYGPLLQRFFSRNGGMDKLLNIYSILIHGTVTLEDGSTLSFTMVKKPPGQVFLNMLNQSTGQEATVLTDGTDTWNWVGDASKNGVHRSTIEQAAALMRESMYCDVAVEVLRSPRVLREMPRQVSTEEPFDMIEMNLPHDVRAQIFLDPKTSRAQRIQLDYDDKDGVPNSYTIMVRDWMDVEGVPEPKSITVFYNGKKLLDCHFNSIGYNLGAYDVLFKRPTETPDPSAPPASPAAPAGPGAPTSSVAPPTDPATQPAAPKT